MKAFIGFLFFFILLSIHGSTAVLTVTHTGDAGEGSLRWAIQQANNASGADSIVFRIPTTDPNYHAQQQYWTIALLKPLPQITDDALTLDGDTQRSMLSKPPDQPLIYISGEKIGDNSAGLVISSADNVVRRLALAGFRSAAIWLKGASAQRNLIQGCIIGVLPDGVTGVFDPLNSARAVDQSRGMLLSQSCKSNRLRANVICNMFFEAILIETAHDNIIEDNLIGVLKDGVTPLGNGWIDIPRYEIENQKIKRHANVRISAGSKRNLLDGNVICAGGRAGVHIESDGTDSTRMIGNYIGVGADGEAHPYCGNAEAGVKVQRGARFTQIGGEAPGEGNIISGNASSGLQVRENVSGTVIAGNLIGLNATATKLVPNAHNGIYLFGQKEIGFPTNNVIGPGNVIIANGAEGEFEPYANTWAAVRLDSSGTALNAIFGNHLGTDAGGSLGSAYNSGVIIGSGARDNVVGPDNVISANRKYGVWIRQAGTVRNTITQNHIFKNGRKAVFLEGGGNAMIQAPEVVVSGGKISGRALPNAVVELFGAEDYHFLASVTATSNGSFSVSVSAEAVATQTDGDGNTSEYSESDNVPVELSLFEAERTESGVLLRWRTESESNNLGFYIERGEGWAEIGFARGAGTTVEAQHYSFLDADPPRGRVVYRLRQVDFDGTVTFSPAVSVQIESPNSYALLPPFPNPFNRQATFVCELPQESVVSLTVVNCLGKVTAQIHDGALPTGVHRFSWDGRNAAEAYAPSGVYFIRMVAGEHRFLQKLLLLQ